MIRRMVASTRFCIALAAFGSLVSAVTLLLYGVAVVLTIVWDTLTGGDVSTSEAKRLSVEFIELTDLFLLGTVLYIVGIGLYDLFVDPGLPIPAWLHIDTLDDLKGKLIQVIVVLLSVTFLGRVVESTGDENILELGAAVALVIGALGLMLGVSARADGKDRERGDDAVRGETAPPA